MKQTSELITKKQVMLEIKDLTSNAHQQLKTPLMRFIRCQQLQSASALLNRAVDAARYGENHSVLAAPPSFIPPLH